MASSNRQIDKPQRGRPERAELPDVNINTGAQSITTERAWAELPDVNINTSAKSMNTEGASLKPHHKIHVDTAAVELKSPSLRFMEGHHTCQGKDSFPCPRKSGNNNFDCLWQIHCHFLKSATLKYCIPPPPPPWSLVKRKLILNTNKFCVDSEKTSVTVMLVCPGYKPSQHPLTKLYKPRAKIKKFQPTITTIIGRFSFKHKNFSLTTRRTIQ